jgi:hypothetical protein
VDKELTSRAYGVMDGGTITAPNINNHYNTKLTTLTAKIFCTFNL